MKKFISNSLLVSLLILSFFILSSCSVATQNKIQLSGKYYADKTEKSYFEFTKGSDQVLYYYETVGNSYAHELVYLDFDYTLSGQEISFTWGNKAADGFKFGELVGKGEISKDQKTIKITQDKSETKTEVGGRGILWDNYGKDNQTSKTVASSESSSSAAETEWKTVIQQYIDQNIHVDLRNTTLTWTQAEYASLVTDETYSSTKGAAGTKLTDILAKYPTPSYARTGFDPNELIISYGSGDKHFVMLTFLRLDDGTYSLLRKTGAGLN